MEYLFVYGVFRDSGKTLLGETTFCGKSTINGKLFKVNEFYPGYVVGDGKVVGDVYLIDPIIFGELDKFEGEEYIRTKARTSSDIECWVYLYKYDTTGIKEIKSGDWMLR
jgi:gamma-glutamylcyclotransferase (GGCT)/AIG2-like uncharacterized protein YtfP